MITKEEVLNALDLIEKYKLQEISNIKQISINEDSRSILLLGLNTREFNCLKAAEIKTIGQLLATDRFELRRFRNLGKKGIEDINKKIADFGINTNPFLTFK